MIFDFQETYYMQQTKIIFLYYYFWYFILFYIFLRPYLAKPIFFFRKTAKKQTYGCICQTPPLTINSFIKKNSKPNKALNILPDFDLSWLTLKQTKNKNSKPKQIKHKKNIKFQFFFDKMNQTQNK